MRTLTIMCILVFACLSVSLADTVDVSIHNFAFTPADLTIVVGDTVRWTNNDSIDHTSTSDTLVWDSGHITPGGTFVFTFADKGDYPYHCEIHDSMTGIIHVVTVDVQGNSLGRAKATFSH